MKLFFFIAVLSCLSSGLFAGGRDKSPSDYVNMLIGSTGKHPTEYGGTVPAVGVPFGMTQWCAATRQNGISRTMYHYDDSTLIGFMGTHQPAVWMGDYGFFTLMPQAGSLKTGREARAVKFDRSQETATPYCYSLSYLDGGHRISTEFTATSRCSVFRIVYPAGERAILFIEAGREKSGGEVNIDTLANSVRIVNRERQDAHLGPPLYNFGCHYTLRFSEPIASFGTWSRDGAGGETRESGKTFEKGSGAGCYVVFGEGTDTVEVRIGSSFISSAQAEENMAAEIPENLSFDGIKAESKRIWDENLGKIRISGASDDDLAVFYTAFFKTLQFPREFSEYGRYYSPFDDGIHEGISYSAYSLWDTFRAQHPWLLLTQPQRVGGMIQSLVNMYNESGWIPKWPNPSFTNIMIGTHADAVISDAYVNGFRDYDVETAYEAIRKDAFTPPDKDLHYRWGDRDFWTGCYEARGGLSNYISLGYVASDKTDESVARTLEFALDDYCISRMAEALGKEEDCRILTERAQNYRNLYNPATGFFQAKRSDGVWDDEDAGFTEGANWTYRFCVMHDAAGLAGLMGGNENFIKALDENFECGHYRHDNEPGHHYAYLYDCCGRLDKTQERVRKIIRDNYRNSPDGLSGNDDLGQMSAWYLFSALGFYPLTPASGEYAIGIPLFRKAVLDLGGGKSLTVIADDPARNACLPVVRFNGKLLDRPFIPVKAILNGGTLEFSGKMKTEVR